MAGNPEDLRVGRRALEKGYISPAQLRKAMVEHTLRLKKAGPAIPSFDFFLLSHGYLSAEQLSVVVTDDSKTDIPTVRETAPAAETFRKFSLLRLIPGFRR